MFSTDINLPATEIYRFYKARFQIEFPFRDAKQFTGLLDCQARCEQSLHFHFNASMAALNLIKMKDRQLTERSDGRVIFFDRKAWNYENRLWEHRNSILHMSNLDSRKVLSGKEKRISFCVALKGYVPSPDLDIQHFNLKELIDEIAQSLSKWIESYNENLEKMVKFIERYDRVISDSRYAIKRIEQ